MKKFTIAIVAWLLCLNALCQKHTISGYISDKKTGEKLRNASILIANKNAGTTSNNYGFYSITLPAGDSLDIYITYAGYAIYEKTIFLNMDFKLDVALEIQKDLDAVVIKAAKKPSIQNKTQMSSIDLPIETIKSLPRFLGEVDIIKAIQLLPGVQAGGEGQSGIYVRGGGPDQNLILLDGVPVYNVSHLFGFFSVFNADAVKNVELIKGGFPARYGGRLSSVLDIQMKEGNKNGLHGEAGIGIIASRLTLEGPFKKGKESSFMVSGRRTYIDVLAQPFIKAQTNGLKTGYYFYDLNAKANIKLSHKDHLYLSGYTGDDRFYAKENSSNLTTNAGIDWGNTTAVVRWNHEFTNKLFGNLSTHYSKYKFQVGTEEKSRTNASEYVKLKYFSGIEDVNVKYDFDYLPNPNHFIKMGMGITFHQYKPGAIQAKESSAGSTPLDTLIKYKFLKAKETDTYIEDDIKLSNNLKTNVGVHFTTFTIGSKTYTSLQARLAARYLLTKDLSVKASFAQMNQYIHLLTNAGLGLPTDLWVPVTERIPAQRSYQLATGLAYNYKNKYEISVEGYYKKMKNIIEYAEGASYINPTSNWEDKVVIGKGWSYGGELFVQKKTGRTTGLMGYTLSWSNRQFDAINFGKKFPYRYDRRHDFKMAIVHKLTKNIEVSADFVFGTGQAITLPVARYLDVDGREVQAYEKRNGYRIAPYHRLDAGISFNKQKRKYSRSWILSVYNVYDRRNPFYLYLGQEAGKPTYKQVSLFPILPSLSYQIKF
jgi:TonB-dependent Receptor Plug Domain/CarboxypepD_reg-like domain